MRIPNKSILAAALALFMAVGLAACGGGSQKKATEIEGPADAVAVYKSSCIACHASDLTGKMGPETDLSKIGLRLSKEEILKVIKEGKGRMPAQSRVSDEDAAKVAEWLATKK